MADEIFAYLEQNTSMRLQQITFAGLKADYFAREKRNFPRVILTAKQKAMSDQKITTITAPFKTWLLAWITAENMAT